MSADETAKQGLTLPINLALGLGAYTTKLYFGSEQVAVDVFAFYCDKYIIRPDLPAIVRRSLDTRCYMLTLQLDEQVFVLQQAAKALYVCHGVISIVRPMGIQ